MPADPRAVDQLFQQALALHRHAQLGLAESHYRRVVKLAPAHADAWHLLGVVAMQQDRAALAIRHFRQAIELRPEFVQAWNNLALALKSTGDTAGAIDALQRAIAMQPTYADAHYNLALLRAAEGDAAAAESCYRAALGLRPDHAGALANLGNLLRASSRVAEAAPFLERAANLDERADALVNLALLRIDQGRYADAGRLVDDALTREGGNARAWQARGIAARLLHNHASAVSALRTALRADPDDVTTEVELALALQDCGEEEESRSRLENLSTKWPEGERLRWLAALSLPAIAADAEAGEASRRRFIRGLDRIESELRLDTPEHVAAAFEAASSMVPFHLHYRAEDNSELQKRFGAIVSRCVAAAAPELVQCCEWRALAHGGPMRVGFVSSHLHAHSVSRFFGSLITERGEGCSETFVWHTGEDRDAATEALAQRVEHFRHHFAPPLDVAREIRAAQLDALVLLDVGMDPGTQVLGSLRLAPLQCAAYGHPVTTGLAGIDFFLSGEELEPTETQADYSEQLVRLPGIGTQPRRPPDGGDGSWLDCDGPPWVLCLQNPLKFTPDFDDLLLDVLTRLPVRVGTFAVVPSIAARWRTRFERRAAERLGMETASAVSRLCVLEPVAHADLVAGIGRAHAVLDTPHFSGGSTSLDAIAAATPLVTVAGSRLRANQSAAMLRIIGMPELVAKDREEQIRILERVVGDNAERERLRERMRKGAPRLFDDPTPARALQSFLNHAVARASALHV